jgi:2-polyprenyl-3-methyl-5-hydroxy-6-metoxy-1,4-benzoquinol methylase
VNEPREWQAPALDSRRSEYRSLRRQDRWIAPLLAASIDACITRFAEPVPAGARCLDVGCGNQPLRQRLEAAGFSYLSVDVNQNAAANVDHLGAIDAALTPDLEAAGPFDFILCTEVLEHVARWPEAFANLALLLKPGGRLLVTCPHIWLPHEEPTDFHRPTSWAVRYFAEQAGLEVLEITRAGDGYDVLGTVLAAVRVQAAPGKPWWWLVATPISLLRKLALAVLSARCLRTKVALPTSLYLSVVAVLEKPQ